MSAIKSTVIALGTLACATNLLESAKILAIFPFKGPSQSYLRTLAERGHEITSASAFSQKTPLKNFRDITLPIEQSQHDEMMFNAIDVMSGSKLVQIQTVKDYTKLTSLMVLRYEEFQKLLRSDEQFDLIIIELFHQDSHYALGQHFRAPMIGVSTFVIDNIRRPYYLVRLQNRKQNVCMCITAVEISAVERIATLSHSRTRAM